MLATIHQLRKTLHQHPELSGQEVETALRICAFIQEHHDTHILTGLGGNGLAVVYEYGGNGPTVMFRCELDALPIAEANAFPHRSTRPGVAHKCGHDGHMAIMAGLALWLKGQSFTAGKVVLLFQPAEETGEGAHAVLNDPRFKELQPDYLFALHNLPGEPLHTIITVPKAFSATVQSVAVYLTGVQSHASEPEKGINPATAMAAIISELDALNVPDVNNPAFTLLTPVHATMGAKAYGISAGEGELHYTLRTWTEDAMQALKAKFQAIVSQACQQKGPQFRLEWFDYFPATINDDYCNEVIEQAAAATGFTVQRRPHPFKFGEDFGWFSRHYKAAFFGLGAGSDHPALHYVDYDFPDEITETGIRLFSQIVRQLLESKDERTASLPL